MRTFTHPESGVELFAEFDCLMILDGHDGLRVERERRTQRGLATESRTGRARNFSLWTATEMVRHAEMNGDVVDLTPLGDTSDAALNEKHKRGEMTPDRLRGEYSVLHLVRWALHGLKNANDLTVAESGVNDIVLTSHSAGLTLTADAASGEAHSLRYVHPRGNLYEWRFEGTLPGAAYPARHPERQFHSLQIPTRGAGAESRDIMYGDVLWFSNLNDATSAALDEFDWRSVGSFAFDKKSGVVMDKAGTVDPVRTETRARFSGYQSSGKEEAGGGPIQTKVVGKTDEPSRPWWAVIAIAVVLSGAGLWWRKGR